MTFGEWFTVERKPFILELLFIVPFFVLFPLSQGLAGTFTLFERSDTGETGGPVEAESAFSVKNPSGEYTLKIFNGGRTGDLEKISAALVAINGAPAADPSDFNQHVDYFERKISVSQNNLLTVELRGKPGGGITIVIEGVDDQPPRIEIDSPRDGLLSNQNHLAFSIRFADDASGIDLQSFQVFLNGADLFSDFLITAAGASGAPAPLSDGAYSLIAQVSDLAGNGATGE